MLALTLSGCSPVHYPTTFPQVYRGASDKVIRQIDYARTYFEKPNGRDFGDLGGTDCVNFTSQTLLARGWKQTAGWKHNLESGGQEYSRAWISSTGLRDYLSGHRELAESLAWSQRDEVEPGDIVQFDWDASGDRDHTAIVSGIATDTTGKRVILVSSHSPAAFDWPLESVLAENSPLTKVYFWRLK